MSEQRKRPIRRVRELLPGIALRLGLEEELRLAQAMTAWERTVAEQVPPAEGATQLLEIRPPTLLVSADDAATGQELRLRSSELLLAFARQPGGQHLLELSVVVRGTPKGVRSRPR
jgi:hypothetical protein